MANLTLHDTATRGKRQFVPRDPARVTMYACGPTVYARAHIGNARPVVVFDVLFRLLRNLYGADAVVYVRNITDIDDKIIDAARESGREIREITEETIAWFRSDSTALGALPPTCEPRATEFVPEMIRLIERLLSRSLAYQVEGHVLFHVPSYADYGSLSGRSRDDMIAGARVEVAPYKRDPADFVLWKPSTAEQPGWESPWGRGRPGWHVECSAMSRELLGESFDIHAGGIDLVFPHHENECAQSRGADPGAEFAGCWLHNGYVQVEGRKMAKSLGNFITLDQVLATHPGEAVRLALLSAHYRQPLNWTEGLVAESKRILANWLAVAEGAEAADEPPAGVRDALADDLNTPKAIAEMHRLAQRRDGPALRAGGELLGLMDPASSEWAKPPPISAEAAQSIDALLARRAEARRARNWAEADAIREGLVMAGVVVWDTAGGQEWRALPEFDPARVAVLERGDSS